MPHLNLLALFSKRVCTSFKTIFVAMLFESTNKKRFLSNALAMVGILLFMAQGSYGQIKTPFTPRLSGGNLKVKGDVVLIGNSIIGRTTTLPIFSPVGDPNGIITNQAVLTAEANQDYNGTASNNASNVEYIDIDTDNNTFSSSSADLLINNSCKRIAFAGLYWTSIYPNDRGTDKDKDFVGTPRKNDWNEVLFKVPNGDYVKLVADNNPDPVGDEDQIIFDGYDPVNINNSFKDSPIICYKNVTNLLSVLSDADGTYTVANLRATLGRRNGGGAGGWTLVVIYESPTMPSKFISVFDGYAGVQSTVTLDIPVAGFKTLPAPFPVNARIGVGALEGDLGIKNDSFQFRSGTPPPTNPLVLFTKVSNTLNPSGTNYPTDGNDNFFNSTITYLNNHVTTRKPKSENTIGYDIDVLDIPNALNGVIPNGETQGTLRLTTTGDGYGAFLTTFAVDIIEPTILLTKEVFDDKGVDASNANVILGQQLNYVIGFENQGNDDATGFTIKDVLPKNIDFVYPDDIDLASLPTNVTHSYTEATRTLIFNIPDALVKKSLTPGGPFVRYEIRFKVKVKPNCNALEDRCDNVIKNSAYATYKGVVNPTQITDDPSISKFTACNLGLPQPTNFLVGINDCIYSQSQVLCEASKTLNGPSGYASYSWTGPFGFTASTETVTVTLPGVYKVYAVGIAPCTDYKEDFTVTPFGGTVVNPIIAYADNKNPDGTITVCPNNGKELPKIFLCGLTGSKSSRTIATGITGATSIVWETTTCAPIPANLSDLCANEDASCTWTSAGPNGPNFVANTAGQFRVTINYDGGCFNRFYFNVYKNTLDFDVTATDIICATPGKIIVNKLPSSGYEYSIDGTNYQSSNTFNITTQNSYTVYVRQVGVLTNPCIFEINNITVRQRNFTVTANASQPLCFGDKGNVLVVANDVEPQYTFNIYTAGGTTPISTSGLQMGNQFTFGNLSPGSYDVEAITENGCSGKQRIVINALTPLTASVDITKPITCNDGELTVTASGGIAPYNYSINGAPFVTSNVFAIPSPGGTYSIRVVDKNNCSYTIPDITINANPKPVFTIAKTDVLCYGAKSGAITFNVTNANGYTLAYSIDNGLNYVSNGTFSSLAPGTYKPILKYTLSGVDCFETRPDITITEPAAALTASAGVSELAGCGPAREGKVRITNPQGGVAPYEYSFDNQATWTTVNDAYKAPGTYTLYVRDANKCIFSASVIVDPEPAEPVINVTPKIDFNCDGTATSTVTVANPPNASYTYDYYLNGVKNTNVPSNVFVNVPSGSHSIKVEYKLNAVPTFSNLLFENFGYGEDTTSPGINTAFYCFERQVVATQCRGSNAINDGDYSVTSFIVNPFGAWVQPGDHTPQTVPPTPKGRSLVVNIGDQIATSDILYQKVINDIIPNQPINFELYAMNLLKTGNTQVNADLRVALVDASGTEISWFATGEIPKTQRWEQYPKTPVTLNPGNNTTLRFIIRSNKRATSGNDVAIDDIKVFQLPKTCISSKTFPLTIDPGKAFTAQITGQKNVTCNGLTNGEFTITATNFDTTKGYEYSINNGANWSAALFISPVTVSNLAGNLYKVIVRPVGSSVAACAKPFDVTISVPTALTLSASVNPPATCTTGATIKASGGGGTPAYQYELRESDGITVVTAYSNNEGVFTNVPAGSYTVFVRDANNCQIPVGVSVSVTAPPALTAALATTTDYCYTTANPARLDVEVTGGTGPFTYKLDGNAAVSSAATTYSFTNVAPGTYTIVVTDTNNCTATISSIVIAPQLGLTVSLLNDLTCLADASIGNPVITGGNGAPYTYTVSQNGGTPVVVSAFPYSATAAGTYVFTVTDSKGCPAASNTITVTAKTTPTITTNKTDITCNNANDGTITVTASGGFTSAYTYEIAGPVTISQFTNKFTGLSAGTYNVKVIDSKGCESAVVQVTMANPTPITANASASTFSCSPTNTKQAAIITVAPTGGTGGYTYSYNNGTSFGSSATLTVNDNGTTQTIRIIVKDANGCLSPMQQIDLAPLNPPTIAAISNTPIYCAPATSTTSTVTVPVTAGTGVAPLAYTIVSGPVTNTTGATTGIFTGLTAGTYVFRVTDANGCYATKSHNVPALTPIAVTATKLTDVDCFGSTTGSARFTVSNSSGGPGSYTVVTSPVIPPAQIAISGNVYTITGLANGTYTFSVTDNTTGCTDSKPVTITQPVAALAITNATATNVFCSNDNSQITVTATGGTTNYGYAAVISGASAPTVFGTSNVITVDTNSGANLVWDVYVRDAKGCTTLPFPVTIINNGSPAVTASVTNQCGASGSSFQIVAVGSGGLAPYTYTINTGLAPSPANTFTVAAGTYTITVRDANGCPATTTVTVNQALTATALVTKDITCSLPQEATIKVDVLGGLAPFGYRVKIGVGTYTGSPIPFAGTTFIYTAAGTIGTSYEFEITDANGTPCTALTNVVTTNTTVPVTATETHVDPTCNGFTDGSIRLTATAGVAPFTYAIALSPATPSSFGSANVFGGLVAGTYNYIVRDAKGCDAVGTINLINPPAITPIIGINGIQCNSVILGSFDVSVNLGGTAPYVYRLYDNSFNQIATYTEISSSVTPVHNFGGLNFGDYYISITDAKGCEFKSSKLRIQPTPYLNLGLVVNSLSCATGVSVTVSVSGGVPNYTYSIFGQPATSSGAIPATSHIFNGLDQNTKYVFEVIDINGCPSYLEFTTPTISPIIINPVVTKNVTCNNANDGEINFTVTNYDASVTDLYYEIRDNLTNVAIIPTKNGTATGLTGAPFNGVITGLKAGNYTLYVKETNGTLCSAVYTFEITQPLQPLTSAVTSNVPATCNSGALVTLTTTGGTGPYQYAYAVAPTVPTGGHVAGNVITLDYNLGTSWIIQVRDANGCTVEVPVTIAKDPEPVIALSVVDKCVAQGTFGILVTETTAGTGAYSISVDGGTFASIPSLPYTVTGLNSGLHTIIIKDANGCTDTETITIDEPLVATPAITALPTCADNDGVITMSGTGGTGTYTYTISPVAGTVTGNVISGLPAGTYTVTITDTATPTNCTTTAVVTLGAPTPVTFTTATTPALCVGDNNGTITVTLGAGNNNPSYTYEIIAGPQLAVAQSSNIFTGLQPGTYTVRVNSGRGCRFDDTNVIVAPATPLTANATFPANTTCSTVTVITVTAGGGTGSGYLYNFNGLGYTSDPTYTVNDNGSIQTISYRVKDANGCETLLQTIDVNPLNKPTDLNFVVSTAPTCPAPTSGVTVTATNGVGALTFEIVQFNGALTTLYPSQITAGFAVPAVFNNLPVGDYMFQVTDTNGCTYQESYTVAPVTNITVAASATTDVTCFGFANGTATFDVANFAGNYNYTFDGAPTNGVNTAQLTFTALSPGLHTLVVTDAITGCQATANVTISQPAAALDFTTTATNINCNNDEATITVTATGGTQTYKYAVVPTTATAPVATAYGLSNLLTVDTNGGTNMVWDVYVMDANGCVTPKTVTIQTDANPSNITVTPFSECPDPINGTYTFTINPPTGVGPFTYSIGGGFQTSATFVVNAPGSYDVTVKDANGCPTTVPALVVIRQPLILTPTVTTPVSCADGDGVVTVSTTGGSGNYVYNIDGGAFASVTSFPNVASGNHTIGVRDTTTLCEVFANVNLQVATPVTGFALAKTEVTCNGGSDGTITATMNTPAPGVNDNPVYTYTLTGTTTVGNLPVTRPAQASPLFSGLAAGTYTVVVTSERGCTDTETITIIEPGLITVPAPAVVEFACTSGNTGNLATITVTGVTGGSGTYLNYEFIKVGTPNTVVQFSNSNVYTEANLLGGSYIVNVYDDKGCIGTSTASIDIAPYVQLDKVNVVVDQAITCTNLENITVSVSTIGGTPANLEFTVQDVIYDTATGTIPTYGTMYKDVQTVTVPNASFIDLPVGNYEITVRNLDTNCEITSVHYVNNPNTFDLTIDNVVDVTCFGGNNGSARVTLIDRVPTPIDNAGAFTYTVTGPTPSTGTATSAGSINLTNLAAGTYTITAVLTNSPFCTVSKNFTITGPTAALAIQETHTAITCVAGYNDGSISATATGGWSGGYEFQLENGATIVSPWSTVSDFNALTAGSYTVKVRDSKVCEVFTTVVLNNPTPIAFTTTTINQALQCNGDTNASITVSVPTGGQGSNYLYTLNTTSATPMISSGPQSGNVFNNLGAGTYTVTVTDGWGCGTTSAPIVINEPTEVVASLVLATTPTCSTQATITLSATGGTGAYEYSAVPTSGWFPMGGNSITFNAGVGTYRYFVRDVNGCIGVVSNDIKVEPIPTLQVALDVQNAKINCNGDTNGVIVATAIGGLGNYVYTLLDGTGNPIVPAPTQLTPGNFTQLPAGTYQVRVDSQDCNVISTGVVTITEPLLPVTATTVVTPVTCNGAANGIINVTASGGTGVIKYAISPRLDQFFDTGVFDQLAPDTYQIIVQDENGCFILLSETITEPQPIFVNTVAGSEIQEVCFGDNNARFDVNITGGVMPYSVTLDDINGTYVTGTATQNVFNFAGLTGGDHTVYIRDFNGCTAEWIVSLDESVNLDPKATVAYGCDNNSPSSTVTVTVDASITNPADVDYALDGSTVFQASNVFSNLTPGFHTITARHSNGCEKTTIQFEVLGFTPLALTLSDGGLNEIVATATGGAGNYQYSFDGGNTFSSNNKLIYYKSGDYTVIVRDANGCEATATRYFEFIDIEIPNVFTPNGDGNNDTWTPTNTINYKDLTINIFDRYGRKVATLREGQGWDGKYNSLELPTGDYWYVLKLKNVQDDREFVGHFTLMR